MALVGARRCSRYGEDAARAFGRGLSRAGVTVVSGLAYGIDREAHLAGLSGPGSSIAVLGSGVASDYPSGNLDVRRRLEREGLVVTELPPWAEPTRRSFPARNRLISGLSLAVVIAEAAARSGALLTARMALEQNREVWAVPGPIDRMTHAGCNQLINEGARLAVSAEALLAELAPLLEARLRPDVGNVVMPPRPTTPPADSCPFGPEENWAQIAAEPSASGEEALPSNLGEDERKAFAALGQEAAHVDALADALGWDAARASRALVLLELQGLAAQMAGMRYRRA